MSFRNLARSRFALARPPSKIGKLSYGVNDQVLRLEENRSDNSSLDVPSTPVSEIRGKNAARAASILALRARSWCGPDVGTPVKQPGRRAGGEVLHD